MQKQIWGLTASMLALTCLTVTGCGTTSNAKSQVSSPSTITVGTTQTNPSGSKEQNQKDKAKKLQQSTTVSSQMNDSHSTNEHSSSTTNSTKTNIFLGKNVQLITGSNMPNAIPNGYTDQHTQLTYSQNKFQKVESFTGTLNHKIFILDFYKSPSNGIAIGVSYNSEPVYFGWGPSPMFDILHFVGDNVLLGSPSVGAYMGINLINGQLITKTKEVVALKGYSGLQPPKYILGLPGTHYSIQIPN
ncbi:hypothetical protein FY534_14325 (plasmid) [Alicyclobacillus sp. TC]|uniref:Uncharacterized protein n=1 Tax=Alicyclobacillus tolerans TaxID=90970 RepID=A0ABT9LYG4_9BACL|nr:MULTISPECIES: hypothetical protein [Alicyclobacillus]MDP9729311.1 hypothetical protein [Alicyclobacillus tengchongensis]QRF24946.1 hypothetical protein FY534_14325 [Alicyclobacillus sp. TC]